MEIDVEDQRAKLSALFEDRRMLALSERPAVRELLRSAWPTADIADLAAFHFLDDLALQQSLLAEADVRLRIGRTVAALERVVAQLPLRGVGAEPGLN